MAAIIGEISLITSIGINHVDFIVSLPKLSTFARSKGNAFTVGGPCRGGVFKGIVRESVLIPPIGVHHVYVQATAPNGLKGDVLAVR